MFLLAIGLSGWASARLTLGTHFAVSPQASKLVQSGVYRKIQNPIYVFSCIYLLGLGMVMELSYRSLILLTAALVAIQIWRARAEKRVLREKFGTEYDEYEKNTWV